MVALANDLAEAVGRSAVSIGWDHSPEAHATVAAINVALQQHWANRRLFESSTSWGYRSAYRHGQGSTSMKAGAVDAQSSSVETQY